MKRHSLLSHLGETIDSSEDVPLSGRDSRASLILRHDDSVIRDVFNSRYGALELMDGVVRAAEINRRSMVLSVIYRLYSVGRSHTPLELRRQLQASEMEIVMSAIKRLALMGHSSVEQLVAYCESNAGNDTDLLAHVMDPFQLRYLLSYSGGATREAIGSAALNTLKSACVRRDEAAVRGWFKTTLRSLKALPLDLPQLLRGVLLELWQKGDADLGPLSQEIAVVDTQLFSELGWETTRAFCAQLRRVTGPGCEALDGYLTDEDIDSALTVSEELKQPDLVAHFQKLATTYSTLAHREVRRTVHARAAVTKTEASPYRSSSSPFAVAPAVAKKSTYPTFSMYPLPGSFRGGMKFPRFVWGRIQFPVTISAMVVEGAAFFR